MTYLSEEQVAECLNESFDAYDQTPDGNDLFSTIVANFAKKLNITEDQLYQLMNKN